jgi:Trk-type K+ transport system membrane component
VIFVLLNLESIWIVDIQIRNRSLGESLYDLVYGFLRNLASDSLNLTGIRDIVRLLKVFSVSIGMGSSGIARRRKIPTLAALMSKTSSMLPNPCVDINWMKSARKIHVGETVIEKEKIDSRDLQCYLVLVPLYASPIYHFIRVKGAAPVTIRVLR